jgi:hypothetical protein
VTPPLAFHPLLIHLKDRTTVRGHYTAGCLFWPAGYRDSERVLIRAEQIERWEYA